MKLATSISSLMLLGALYFGYKKYSKYDDYRQKLNSLVQQIEKKYDLDKTDGFPEDESLRKFMAHELRIGNPEKIPAMIRIDHSTRLAGDTLYLDKDSLDSLLTNLK